jgi:gluconate 2-dehydrogenase alpha chain
MSAYTFVSLNFWEASVLSAIVDRIFLEDESGPAASEIGVVTFIDLALAGPCQDLREDYRVGLAALNAAAVAAFSVDFPQCSAEDQDVLLGRLQRGELDSLPSAMQIDFFDTVRGHCLEGLFSDPVYGGNRDKSGWKTIGHPGVWLENTAEENLSTDPVDKGGVIQSLADVRTQLEDLANRIPSPRGCGESRGLLEPVEEADVVLVGVGAAGGVIAPILAGAGLKVVGLEAGPWWDLASFLPDELGTAYYCRAAMGKKFAAETPRWLRVPEGPEQEATFSLGRMMNGVGGSAIHYGAWLRRFHPHHFRFRSHVAERWGTDRIPEGCTIADWPITYDELERYFTCLEQSIGVAGDETNPFLSRSKPLPLPPMRPFTMGESFRKAATSLGLHPHPSPVGQNTLPFNGYPETTYCAWNNGFGSWTGDKWHPALTSVQQAIDTGNFDLRTHCRVIRINIGRDGRAAGVAYLDPLGRLKTQKARVVILCAYTYENVRLMFLSGDEHRQSGLGNNMGQLGRHYMTKQFAHVDGYFPHSVFNRHTGPASQAVVLDDYLAEEFDSVGEGGFIGGATLGAENQFLPIQIARESLPSDVPSWGAEYKSHLRNWQHLAVVRMQPDALPYETHRIDLDPIYRDRSGLGLPVVRLTYDLMPNEIRQAEYFENRSAEILREMGATKTWTGSRFTGVGSSHDLGGCRMADSPADGVVDCNLQVHDTPGLYVFGGSVFPSCPGINPTLTMWALCLLAADRLVERLRNGEE